MVTTNISKRLVGTLMAISTGRAGASFLAPQPRICIPLVDLEQVRIFHWQIWSNPLCDGAFRVAIVAPSCRGGFHRNSSNTVRSFPVVGQLLSSTFFEVVSDHPVHLFTFLKWRRLTLLDELLVCFLLLAIARVRVLTAVAKAMTSNRTCSTK